MEKKIYIIRHCEAEGQPFEANLTEKGFEQAEALADFFADVKVDLILSSPFLRAVQTIEPLAEKIHLEVVVDDRLAERVLSTKPIDDWMDKLKATFVDLDLALEGGESSQQAMDRAVSVVDDLFKSDIQNALIVTHGNLMSLLIKFFNQEFGFEEWRRLSNPDVYLLQFDDVGASIGRLLIGTEA